MTTTPEFAFAVKDEQGREAKVVVMFLENGIVRIVTRDAANGTAQYNCRWSGSGWTTIGAPDLRVDEQEGGAFEFLSEREAE